MARSSNLTNKFGRKIRGNTLVYYLPAPTVISKPNESCLDNRERRIRIALNRIELDEKTTVEGVHVERRGTERRVPRFAVNFSGHHTPDEAVERICRIMDNRLKP
jgi:hypothetical protein